MAIRILMIIIAFTLVVNLVLTLVGFFSRVNLYEKYGKQIQNFFIGFALFIIAVYVILAIIGLA
jgi:hypothetical protein